jgi:hypothetical protein
MPILVVEKGHCYRTTGSTGTTGEQDYATLAANTIAAIIHGKEGWEVRQKLADAGSYSGDAFVAVHCDGSTNSTARGSSVGFQNNEGSTFGQAWMNGYAALGWTGGFRPPNYTEGLAEYYGVRNAISVSNRRAIIVECGFMTNPDDKALMTGPGGPERVANAIAFALGLDVEDAMAAVDWDAQYTHGRTGKRAFYGDWIGEMKEEVDTTLSQVKALTQAVATLTATVDTLAEKVDEIAARPPAVAEFPNPLDIRMVQ